MLRVYSKQLKANQHSIDDQAFMRGLLCNNIVSINSTVFSLADCQ